jgi:hypothetical protein
LAVVSRHHRVMAELRQKLGRRSAFAAAVSGVPMPPIVGMM